jgi:hypothetical protein
MEEIQKLFIAYFLKQIHSSLQIGTKAQKKQLPALTAGPFPDLYSFRKTKRLFQVNTHGKTIELPVAMNVNINTVF